MCANPPKKDVILILDDEPEIGLFLGRIAATVGFTSESVSSYDEFQAKLNEFSPTCVMMDLQMPDVDGIEILRFLAKTGCQSDIVIMSGFDHKVIDSARQLGQERGLRITDTIQKPFRADHVISILEGLRQTEIVIDADGISHAMAQRQFELYYLPTLNLAAPNAKAPGGYDLIGFEGLLRWNHPTRGILPPAEFLPIAEDAAMMDQMSEMVFGLALKTQQKLGSAGVSVPLSINMSPSNLYDAGLPDIFGERCREAGVAPGTIVIELTETAAMRDPMTSMDFLTQLRSKGFGLSVDDFGTGFSSLVQLQKLPFSELKIDRSFISDCDKSEQSRTLVKSMIDIAKNLGLSSTAEGVESDAEVDFLRSCGCDSAQGFLFSEAVPYDRLAKWIAPS